jgi:hypothetical protein
MPLRRILYYWGMEHTKERWEPRASVETSGRQLRNPKGVARQCPAAVDQKLAPQIEQGIAMEYSFTLKYQLGERDQNLDDIVERLGVAGCDDALVGMGQAGRIALDFTREAHSAQVAFMSALADVKRAIPSARLIEAVPDLVGLTDVAEAIGVTRQNMRKLMIVHATSFPAPIHDGSTAIWHLADILTWLRARGTYQLEAGLFEVAAIAMQINLAKAACQIVPSVRREVRALLA